MEKMTPEQFMEISNNLKKAEADDTPYPVVNEEKVYVVGDPNKTEMKKHSYTIQFRYPRSKQPYFQGIESAKVVGSFIIFDVEYTDISVPAAKDLKLITSITKMMSFFKKIEDDGGVENLSGDEMIALLESVDEDILDSVYAVIGAFLAIGEDELSHVLIPCAFETVNKLIGDFPEVFNEGDAVFGLSQENQS